jgi:hypothetical protein
VGALLKGGLDGDVLTGFGSNDESSFIRMSSIWFRTTIIPKSNSRRCFGFWHTGRLCAITSNWAAKLPNC